MVSNDAETTSSTQTIISHKVGNLRLQVTLKSFFMERWKQNSYCRTLGKSGR